MSYRNILLIDDDPEDAELFLEAVDSLRKGNKVRWESNTERALEDMQEYNNLPDLIFMDYNMPRINGFEMLERLKNDRKLQDIPVILISGPSQEYMQENFNSDKIMKYISKPSSFGELTAVLDAIL